MVLRGTQIHWRGQARCGLVSAQSLPHDLARLYDRALSLTSTDLDGVADPYIDVARLLRNQSPMPKGHSIYPVIALIVLTLFTWIVAMWASCNDREEPHDVEKPEKSSDEQDHRKAGEDLLSRVPVPNARWRPL